MHSELCPQEIHGKENVLKMWVTLLRESPIICEMRDARATVVATRICWPASSSAAATLDHLNFHFPTPHGWYFLEYGRRRKLQPVPVSTSSTLLNRKKSQPRITTSIINNVFFHLLHYIPSDWLVPSPVIIILKHSFHPAMQTLLSMNCLILTMCPPCCPPPVVVAKALSI